VELSPVGRKFVLHWGEMGTRWGVNRTVAQIHALLYLAPGPLNAEEIALTLGVARSNVSGSLKELQTWGVVRVVHVMGDRRDHFESLRDVWEMFQIVMDQRKRREIDPTLELLRQCLAEAEKAGTAEIATRDKLRPLLDFFESVNTWYLQIRMLPTQAVIKFVRLGGKVRKLLGVA
jgi:DNA-binding transcriptional regulator GbsR (MarR family)